MEQISSPEMFDSPFFSLDNSMPASSVFDPSHQGSAHGQLHVPRQAFMPFAQQAYAHSYAHPQNRQQHQSSYPSSPSWQLHSRQHQHAIPQYANHYSFGMRHHPFALSQALHAKSTTETKARLDKKHVEILEHEFSKNQKPSSIVKRELAEQMGHEVARINNWFQNRRAKEKSNRRTAEYAAREANNQHDSSEEGSTRPPSPEQRIKDERDDRLALDNLRRPIMSSAMIGEPGPEEDDASEEQEQPYQSGVDETGNSQCADDDNHSHTQSEGSGPVVLITHDTVKPEGGQEQFRTPDSDLNRFDYRGYQSTSMTQNPAASLEYLDEEEIATAWFHPLPQAPSDYFGTDAAPLSMLNAGAPLAMGQFSCDDALKVQQLASPVSMASTSQTPPPPKDMVSRLGLKSPRPINIAARRNHQRPAPLGLAISRKASYTQGPKTGIEMPRRADEITPMRRTASATGLRRLQRVSEGLRSPGIRFQGVGSPSHNSSTSPVSPGRSDSPATNQSDEHQHGLPYSNFNAPLTSRFDNAISTPPVTPGLPLGYPGGAYHNPFEQAWANAPGVTSSGGIEQPLATPSLCSHGGSEMDFPGNSNPTASSHPGLPSYIANNSQPATPGFSRSDTFGPGFRYGNAMANAPEYMFPDSSVYMHGSSSPEQPMSKTFQFAQNVTPLDFGAEN